MLQNYHFIEGNSLPQWREAAVAAGDRLGSEDHTRRAVCRRRQIYSAGDHSFAAATGRYAGRKAADYARQVAQAPLSKEQVVAEKPRVYAPIKRNEGMDWKELHAGIARAMQFFCSEYKTEPF